MIEGATSTPHYATKKIFFSLFLLQIKQ